MYKYIDYGPSGSLTDADGAWAELELDTPVLV